MNHTWCAVDSPKFHQRLKQLSIPSHALDGYWCSCVDQSSAAVILEWFEGVFRLRATDAALGSPLSVEFTSGKSAFRVQRAAHEMLVKAVKGRSKDVSTVVDATAGLGRDSLILAAAGFQVDAFERHPAIGCLLADGLDRAADHVDFEGVINRVNLTLEDAITSVSAKSPDVVYLDPMFPERHKQALVKKEMRIFQALVGSDHDEKLLLEWARNHARKRVVVKRPRKSEPLASILPGYQLVGKSSRFDVYPA